MTPFQDILINTNRNVRLTINIIKASSNSPFTTEVLVFDPEFNPQYSSLTSIAGIFENAEEAFSASFKWVSEFCAARKQEIILINNVCNCEFLSAEAQQKIVTESGLTVTVTVNA